MSSRHRGKWLLAGARRLARHQRRRGRKRCTVGVTRGARSSTCTATSSRPSRRALRWVGTASDTYLAKPRENQGTVMLPAHAAQWLPQRPRPPGEEALYKYPTRPSGVPPRKRALVVWKPPQSRCAVPLEHVPSLASRLRSAHHPQHGDLSYSSCPWPMPHG